MTALATTEKGEVSVRTVAASPPLSIGAVALVVIVLATHMLLAWHLRVWGITSVDDDAGYLLLARALRAGHFRELHDAMLPIGAKYPPAYPAMLALASIAVGERMDWLLVLSIVSSLVALGCLFDVVRYRWGVAFALVTLTLAALNPYVIRNAGRLMSEAPFMALAMIALRAAARRPETRGAVWVTGVATIIAALTRSVGVTLVAAIGLLWLAERRFRRVVVFGIASAVTVGAWSVWTLVAPNAKERGLYSADALETGGAPSFAHALINRVRDNTYQYGVDILPAEIQAPTIPGTVVDNVVLVAVMAVLLAVGFVPLWRQWRPAAFFLGLYSLLLALWAWPIERFLEPVLPLIVLTLLLGGRAIGARLGHRLVWAPVALVAVALGGRSLVSIRTAVAAQARCDRARPTVTGCVTPIEASFFEATRFVADSIPPGTVVATAKTRPFYYYSGHRAVDPDFFLWLPPDEVVPRLRAIGVDYLLLTELGFHTDELRTIVETTCGSFDLVREFAPTTILLELRPAHHSTTDTPTCRALAAARKQVPPKPLSAQRR